MIDDRGVRAGKRVFDPLLVAAEKKPGVATKGVGFSLTRKKVKTLSLHPLLPNDRRVLG